MKNRVSHSVQQYTTVFRLQNSVTENAAAEAEIPGGGNSGQIWLMSQEPQLKISFY